MTDNTYSILEKKAFNMFIIKTLWKKYRGRLGEERKGKNASKDSNSLFQCLDISPRSVDQIIVGNHVKCLEKKAGEIESKTGISKKYLLGEEYIIISNEKRLLSKMKKYKKSYDTMHSIERLTKEINQKLNIKEPKQNDLYDIEENRTEREDLIIYDFVGINEEYDNIVDNMKEIKHIFESEMIKASGEEIRNKYNQFRQNVIDMVNDKTDSLNEENLMINEETLTMAKTVKENIKIIKGAIADACITYGEMETEFEKELDKLDIVNLDIEENKDLYCLLYFIINNKKYETP